jgi:hypothetical protein
VECSTVYTAAKEWCASGRIIFCSVVDKTDSQAEEGEEQERNINDMKWF